jgi:triphosphoribosyl-dephospho-CoA synthase
VQATRAAVGCNTNLGIILLAAPLIMAAEKATVKQEIREQLQDILENTTVADADWVFRAISLAAPGGLGESDKQDVTEAASVTLTEAMRLASERDRIALQYITNYKDIFDFLILRYNSAFNRWGDTGWSAAAVFTAMLAKYPDSHIERKYDNLHTRMVMDTMALVDDKLSTTERPEQLEDYLRNVDTEFKSAGINPGTTADLTVITVLVATLQLLY